MRLTWYGHSCFLLETGEHRLLFDPFLNGNPSAPVGPADIRCDFILVTHAHEDHLGDALEIANANCAPIVAPYELARHLEAQGATTIDLSAGGSAPLPFGRVKLTHALHHSALEQPDGRNLPLGSPGGFRLTLENGKTLYHAGDTALFGDMRLIARGGLDVALLPIGDWYTMGIDDALDALDLLTPKLALPMHYNTFKNIRVDVQDFVTRAAARGHTVLAPAPGGTVEIPD